MKTQCEAYCVHGGRCSLPSGHGAYHRADGHNGTPRCLFDDTEAVRKPKADSKLREKLRAQGFSEKVIDFICRG